VAWKRPWSSWQDRKNVPQMATFVTMLVEAPRMIRNKHRVDPNRPPAITTTGERRSPSIPVTKEPPAYVNMNPESMAARVSGFTPAAIKESLTLV
jgi:hypothetical protein